MRPQIYPQAPAAVVMVRPHHFTPNPQTAADNAFQRSDLGRQADEVAQQAYAEVTEAARLLQQHGVQVHLFEDEHHGRTPDAVFPNNWFSTHAGGHVALYPMYSDAVDAQGRAVYHTNVLMCVATDFALVGLELIADTARSTEVRQRLEDTGREVVALSAQQIGEFAGNALELSNGQDRLLALSSRALQSLQPQQIKTLERSVRLLPLRV